jgi:hypothetical protein
MPGLSAPDDTTRWRCAQCGNLTRFDVVRSVRVKQYWHVALSGVPEITDEDVLSELIESVTCRWCGSRAGIELVARPSAEASSPTGSTS